MSNDDASWHLLAFYPSFLPFFRCRALESSKGLTSTGQLT